MQAESQLSDMLVNLVIKDNRMCSCIHMRVSGLSSICLWHILFYATKLFWHCRFPFNHPLSFSCRSLLLCVTMHALHTFLIATQTDPAPLLQPGSLGEAKVSGILMLVVEGASYSEVYVRVCACVCVCACRAHLSPDLPCI